MEKAKDIAIETIEAKKDIIIDLADSIWHYAELSLQEEKSARKFCEILSAQGFDLEKGICGIPTAFAASYGSGRPYIGILAEYDALSGLSQKAGSPVRESVVNGGAGHGCGHNLLGAGALAAALGVQAYLKDKPGKGTVILYGCPGEEGGAAKAFMARDGIFASLDAAITWHPGSTNEVITGTSNSCIQTQYKFTGIAAHAAGEPEQGRSALDAVQLMNLGTEFLREHMSSKARIHYAITNGGGISPNVVQPKASVLYMVRSNKVAEAIELQKRVDKIAEGAAMMTETTLEKQFIDGTADTIPNHTLEKVLYDNFALLGVPQYSEDEINFANELYKTYPSGGKLPGIGAENDPEIAKTVKELKAAHNDAMNDFLMPLYSGEAFSPGSTDVGDVSHLCPTGQIHVAAWPDGTPGHSWQSVSCAGMSIGHKAAVHSGKVMACAVIDLFEEPAIIKKAKEEFDANAPLPFISPIPENAFPVIPEL